MGKITMPKNSALLDEIESALKIYYEENDWLSNASYTTRLKKIIGGTQYRSSYTKKTQILSYFGLVTWEDFSNSRSKRKITASGREFYLNLINKNIDGIQENLLNAIDKNIFGKNVCGCPSSDSNVEPPALCIRAILDLEYITYSEYAFLLWELADNGGGYSNTINEIKKCRKQALPVPIPDEAKTYKDAKPIMALIRWAFLSESPIPLTNKHITIHKAVLANHKERLSTLNIYNDGKIIPKEVFTIDNDQVAAIEDLYDTVTDQLESGIKKAKILDEKSNTLINLNNRTPESINTKNGKKYKTDPRIVKSANNINNFCCAVDNSHETFTLDSSVNYIEGHHIIPMKAQKDFTINLDRIENITSLCPTCHRAIHFATFTHKKVLLEKVYTKNRQTSLRKAGIDISLENLMKEYY
jgi:HNH endonuclease